MTNIELIYIVEDDSVASYVIKKIIGQKLEYGNCFVFQNGKVALDKLLDDKNDPDFILLDINMPVMDGWEFLDACKEINKDTIPVFLLSSSINPADKERAKSYKQVCGFLTKPFTRDNLEDIFGLVGK